MAEASSTNKWALIGALATIVSLITGIFAVDGRYAKAADAAKQEQQVIKTLEGFQDKMDLKFEMQRLQTLKDQSIQHRLWMKQMPNDSDIKSDYEKLQSEIKATQTNIDVLLKGK